MDLKTRAINMITKPAAEWRVVASERQTVESLIKGYAAPLSAIPIVCSFIGVTLLVSVLPFMGGYSRGVVSGVIGGVVQWILGLVGIVVCAIVIEMLAPKFNSTPNRVQALKMVVFASTPLWLAGVFNLIPVLSLLILIALAYSIYVFYLGLPPVMNTPQQQVVPYMAISVLVMFFIAMVLGMISGMVALVIAGAAAVVS